jgi:hypothetical protein
LGGLDHTFFFKRVEPIGAVFKRTSEQHKSAVKVLKPLLPADIIGVGTVHGCTSSSERSSFMRKRRAAPKFSHPPRGAWRKATGLGALFSKAR